MTASARSTSAASLHACEFASSLAMLQGRLSFGLRVSCPNSTLSALMPSSCKCVGLSRRWWYTCSASAPVLYASTRTGRPCAYPVSNHPATDGHGAPCVAASCGGAPAPVGLAAGDLVTIAATVSMCSRQDVPTSVTVFNLKAEKFLLRCDTGATAGRADGRPVRGPEGGGAEGACSGGGEEEASAAEEDDVARCAAMARSAR